MSYAKSTTRKNILSLTKEELERLQVALHRMQTENKGVDWCCVAGIHGGGLPNVPEVKIDKKGRNGKDGFWCVHGGDKFPIWHRPYMWEFEQLINKYDPKPEKGRLGIPYWDWIQSPEIPVMCRNATVVIPLKGKLTTVVNPLYSGPSKAHSTGTAPGQRTQRKGKPDTRPAKMAITALTEDNYPEFASRDNPVSIESAHNYVHGMVGGDMGSVGTAAFDPIFWLHHNNIERCFFSFQRAHSSMLPDFSAEEDLAPFPPVVQPKGGKTVATTHGLFSWTNTTKKYSLVKDWWKVSDLDYTYDAFPPVSVIKNQIRDRRRFIVFWDVPHPNQSLWIKVWIHQKGKPKPATSFGNEYHSEYSDPTFAGQIFIFAFDQSTNDAYCGECENRADRAYTLDVTEMLDSLGAKNKETANAMIEVTYKVSDINGADIDEKPAFQNKGLSAPELLWENEFFSDSIDFNKIDDIKLESRDVQRVRQLLAYYGYNPGSGSKKLNDALMKFQQQWGLKADGVLGPVTQEFMTRPRSANSDVGDDTKPVLLNRIKRGRYKLKYTISNVDEDLLDLGSADHGFGRLQKTVEDALKSWAVPLSAKIGHQISFDYVDMQKAESRNKPIDLEITWRLFDGIGGTLGYASSKTGYEIDASKVAKCSIQLDVSEKWSLDNTKKYAVQPVLTHELGHLFGLQHDNREDTVMNPYYDAKKLAPLPRDIEHVVELFNKPKASSSSSSSSKKDSDSDDD